MMTTRYRLLDHIDWDALNGERVTLQVSPASLIATKKDGSIVVLAKAVQPRGKIIRKPQPSWEELERTTGLPRDELELDA